MAEHTIQAGQVYESCDPRGGPAIRVVAHEQGAGRADVVDADTGKQWRSILTSALHGAGVTQAGRERRTGYRLVDRGSRG